MVARVLVLVALFSWRSFLVVRPSSIHKRGPSYAPFVSPLSLPPKSSGKCTAMGLSRRSYKSCWSIEVLETESRESNLITVSHSLRKNTSKFVRNLKVNSWTQHIFSSSSSRKLGYLGSITAITWSHLFYRTRKNGGSLVWRLPPCTARLATNAIVFVLNSFYVSFFV